MEKQAAFKVDSDLWKKFMSRTREVSGDSLTASVYLAKFVEWALSQEDMGMTQILGEIPSGKVERPDDTRLMGILESLVSKIDGLDSRLSSLEDGQKKS